MAQKTKLSLEKTSSVNSRSKVKKKTISPKFIPNSIPKKFPIVGIGSSAGGLDALERFFVHMPIDSGMSFVIIQHLDPTYKSQLSTLFQRFTSMKVFQANSRMKVEPNCIYVIPPNKYLTISNGLLCLSDQEADRKLHLPIDIFLGALALDLGEFAAGVVLSGMCSDGTIGLEAIKKHKGLTLAQDPLTCSFSSMPRSAIDAGYVDIIASAEELPNKIIHYFNKELNNVDVKRTVKKRNSSALDEIMALLHEHTGNDFSQYKESTMRRRIERRMKFQQLDTIAAYVHYLNENPHELDQLFKELLINVTHFFRDSELWGYLKSEILPSLLTAYPAGKTLRVWVPACSTGEEAYGLAILFKEIVNELDLGPQYAIKIFATDLDQDAISQARRAFYPSNISAMISPERLNQFFIAYEDGYQLCKEIRDMVIFAPQNIVTDIPFSKLDILSCRNLLIYFNRELQEKLLSLFHYALNPGGILLLGSAETIDRFQGLFNPLQRQLHVYQCVEDVMQPESSGYLTKYFPSFNVAERKAPVINSEESMPLLLDQLSRQGYSPASVLVNANGDILHVRKYPNKDLETAQNHRNTDPVHDVTLASLMTELQLSREEIHATNEEMQTSQEELRSSNEELQSANEELQCANKELLAANEALTTTQTKSYSLNQELQTVNAELTTYLEAIGQLALVSVSDRSGKIVEANDRFCEVCGYSRAELIGQDHRILNSGLHPKAFFVEMWAKIVHGAIWHKEICNKRKNGELYWVDSTIVPLKDNNGHIVSYVSVRVDITVRKQKELILRERLKERICLYAIRRDMEQELSVSELCTQIFNRLIPAMQFPDFAACIIELDNKQYASDNYSEDLIHGIFSKIRVNGKICGRLEVFYTEEKSFLLPDEQNLINLIADDFRMWLERKQSEQRINFMASHDVLTGLPNRLLLQDRISQAIAYNLRHHSITAVLFIDLDHFKYTNDSLGHSIGDLLLKDVAARLLCSIRSEDTAARQGGDEFIVVLPYITDTHDVESVAQKILNAMVQPYYINDKELHIGASIGIALYPDDGEDADTLLKHSDTAMYHAKASGRNNYQFFTREMNLLTTERHDLGIDLRSAVKNKDFLLYFQPVVDMNSGKLVGMEVLLRWKHADKGLISPNKFINLAEDTGLIIPIGDWVVKSVCLQIKLWKEQGYDVPQLAINLSAKQFQRKSLIKDIVSTLEEYDISANCLALEITESTLVENVDEVVETLSQLSAMGFKILIDDFGTGYSNLSYLKHFTIDTLKIDRSFVKDVVSDENDAAIVTAIVAMAHSLNMNVIAEGVETEEQVDFLYQKGCDQYQGYYFSEPLPPSEIVNKLTKTLEKA